jgi:hypothetical protein
LEKEVAKKHSHIYSLCPPSFFIEMRKKHFCHQPKKYSRSHGKIGVCRDPGIRLTIFAVSQDFCLQFASWPSVKRYFAVSLTFGSWQRPGFTANSKFPAVTI